MTDAEEKQGLENIKAMISVHTSLDHALGHGGQYEDVVMVPLSKFQISMLMSIIVNQLGLDRSANITSA